MIRNLHLLLTLALSTTIVRSEAQSSPSEYGVPSQGQGPRNSYGPPGHTPGVPLGSSSSSSSCPPNDPQKNLELVKKVYQSAFGDQSTESLEEYVSSSYIDHNPMSTDGLEHLKELVMRIASSGAPKGKIEFMRTAADGDLVWTHTRLPFFGKIYATVDIFRIECGKIAEHWDVMQDINAPGIVSSHPFF